MAGAVSAVIALTALITSPASEAVATTAPHAASASGDASVSSATSTRLTANLADFQPGNIISDAVFFNSGTMTAAQIQAFLDSKVPSCRSGYTCLKDWYDTSRATNADAMCRAYPGGARERASTIIYKVAQACGINPQVILATLQKEQALVLHTWPSEWRYKAAMGQGCPDTAACDSRYYGFFNQVFGAAWQFKRYANPSGTSQYFTWYAPGRTWNVRYHPTVSCGSSPVYIQNQATANLYYYTPYQPNAASLAAGYGIASDSCSSYGNRNFYNYFTDWFGSSQGETLQVLEVSGTSQRYLVSNGSRWRLTTPELSAQFTWISPVRQVTQADIDAYQDRGAAVRAIRTTSGIVYLLDSGRRLRLRDAVEVSDYGWDYGSLPVASDAQVARYPDAGWLERVVRSGGQSYLVQSSSRRQVVDLGILQRYGIPALSTEVSAAMAGEYPTASPVLGVGVYRDATNPYRLLTDGGTYVLPDAASGTPIAGSARELTAESFAFLKASQSLPVRMVSGSRAFVLLEDGWLEVSAREYPTGLPFTQLPAGSTAGIPSSGREAGPHFLRERSDAQVYLVSGGTVQAVSSSDQAWITRTYGVNPRVWVGMDGVISGGLVIEGLVKTGAGAAYLLDGARAYRMRDCGQVASWGADCATLPMVTAAKLAGYADGGTLQMLVRTPAGTIWLPQAGRLRQVLDPAILAAYGIPASTSLVSAETAARLPVGEPVLAAGIYSDDGGARVAVTGGGKYSLTPDQTVGAIRSASRALVPASFAAITVDGALPSRMLSDGRAFVLTAEGWLEVSSAEYGGDGVFTARPSGAWKGIFVAATERRPHFVHDDASASDYLISGGAAQPVSGSAERANITAAYGVPVKVWPLAGGALSGVRIAYDLIVKSVSGDLYLMDGSTRFTMSGCPAVAEFGRDCATVRTLTASQLAVTRDGGALAPLLRSPDGFSWLIQSATRREVPDVRVLAPYGIGGATTAVSALLLAQLRLGAPVVSVGVYDDRAGDVRVVTGDGRIFILPAASRIGSVTANAWRISAASLELLSAEGDLPSRVTTGSAAYVLTGEGWLAVDASAYGPLTFASIGGRSVAGVPSAGTEMRPHFVREQSDSQVYLASGGLMPVGDDAERARITAAYGVPGKVWVVPDGTLG